MNLQKWKSCSFTILLVSYLNQQLKDEQFLMKRMIYQICKHFLSTDESDKIGKTKNQWLLNLASSSIYHIKSFIGVFKVSGSTFTNMHAQLNETIMKLIITIEDYRGSCRSSVNMYGPHINANVPRIDDSPRAVPLTCVGKA